MNGDGYSSEMKVIEEHREMIVQALCGGEI